MQRKPGYPMVNCNIKMPEGMPVTESVPMVEDGEQMQRRQQLINFGHAQWGFNNWSWSVTKQDLDFVDFTNGKYWVGVAAYVSINVKTLDIHRENVGYATCSAVTKGAAIHKSRKVAVTNALRETLLSFGGSVATELIEHEAPTESTAVETVPAPTPVPNIPAPTPVPNVPAACTPAVPPAVPHIPQHVPAAAATAVAAVKPCEAVAARARRVEGAALRAPAPPQPPGVSRAPPRAPPQPRPASNDAAGKLENMNEEEARAERKRRQQKAQEEFRQRQQMMQPKHEDKEDLQKGTSFDTLLMGIHSQEQDIEIEQTGEGPPTKRKSPTPEQSSKRRSVINRLDVITN